MTLEIEVYPPVNGNQYVMLGGRLDTLSHAQLDEALAPMLAARPQALVLDLAHLDYISRPCRWTRSSSPPPMPMPTWTRCSDGSSTARKSPDRIL